MEVHSQCPIRDALNGLKLGNKWTLDIIRDLFDGKRYFTEFLNSNPNLSKKVLSERLREMGQNKLIEKIIVSESPMIIEYALTEKGEALNKVLYELAMFKIKTDQEYQQNVDVSQVQSELREKLRISST